MLFCNVDVKDNSKIYTNLAEKSRRKYSLTHFDFNITLIAKPKKKEIKKEKEKCKPIYFMSVDIKLLNKILTDWMQQYTTRIIYYDQEEFIPGTQV